jgi:hypothetical protein
MRRPQGVIFAHTDQNLLPGWLPSRAVPVRQVERARNIMGAAAGRPYNDLAAHLDFSNQRCARPRRRL